MLLLTRVHTSRGSSLLDALIGAALMVLVFTGVSGVFRLSIELVSNNKARVGALALAQDQMEYLRSLAYSALGTQSGIPSGVVPQIEQISLNGVAYTRRTLIRYMDDPKDGTGAADTNGITADSKEVKVELSWTSRGVLRATSLVSRVSPVGIEQVVPGGTLSIYVVNASGTPVPGALVDVVNASTSVDTQAYSDTDGLVQFIGTPSGTGYRITVSKGGYSSAYTYTASSTNPSPSPGHLTVSNNQTTASTFAIDTLASHTVRTFEAVQEKEWADSFANNTLIGAQSSTTVSGGALMLSGGAGSYESEGYVRSVPIAPSYLASWNNVSFAHDTPLGTSVRYRVYGGDTGPLIPEATLPGNSAGFVNSPVDLSSVSTSTYPSVRVEATLTTLDPAATPEITSWEVRYDQGPIPLPGLDFTLTGAKTIGTNAGAPVYKYSAVHTSNAGGGVDLTSLEWDTYALSVNGAAEGFDVAESCEPQPRAVSPGASVTTAVYLVPHTTNSLLVDVRDTNGVLVQGATVRLSRGIFEEEGVSRACGQVFFEGLSTGSSGTGDPYSIQVTASGYQAYTAADVTISGASRYSVILSI